MQAFRLNILVADDAGIIHELFDDILANLPIPFDVVHVPDGQQCVDALKAGGIHLAFIDVNMPGMSGIEAVGQARTLGSKTFVTLMSTNASGVRMQLAHQLKVYEFLAKPFSALDVLRVVKTYCRVTVPSNVLVVDDSATVRRIIQKVFATSIFNIDVTEAADGMSALEHCKAGAFHAVFLDC